MSNEDKGFYVSLIGKIVAVGAALLSIAHIIKSNGTILWICIIIGVFLVFLGKIIKRK